MSGTEDLVAAFEEVAARSLAGAAGERRPVLCVETERGVARDQRVRIAADVLDLFTEHEHTTGIADVLFHPKFPVDIRHNAKIRREVLASWAARRLR